MSTPTTPQTLSIAKLMQSEGNASSAINIEKTENGVILTVSGPGVHRRQVFEGAAEKVATKVQDAVVKLITA